MFTGSKSSLQGVKEDKGSKSSLQGVKEEKGSKSSLQGVKEDIKGVKVVYRKYKRG